MKQSDVYLGDGLYASFDGFQFVLRAPREGGDHWVALEPQVLQAFLAFVIEKQGKKDLRNETV
jgi:hypothetical protein